MKKITGWAVGFFVSLAAAFTFLNMALNVSTKAELARLRGEISLAEHGWLFRAQEISVIVFGALAVFCLAMLVVSIIRFHRKDR